MKTIAGGWRLPAHDDHFTSSDYQQWRFVRAMQYVTRFRTAVDVGAHVGFMSAAMAEAFEMVHAFEPSPDSFECLTINAPPNVHAHMVALWSSEGWGNIAQDDRVPNNTGGRYVSFLNDDEEEPARLQTLDSFGLQDVDFIKIDTDGAEAEVVSGARVTIERCRPVIIWEDSKKVPGDRFESGPDDVVRLLTELGMKEVEVCKSDRIWGWPR